MTRSNLTLIVAFVLLGILVGYGCQVVYGTNKSSYKIGFDSAFADYHCTAHDKTLAHGDPEKACDDGLDYYPAVGDRV